MLTCEFKMTCSYCACIEFLKADNKHEAAQGFRSRGWSKLKNGIEMLWACKGCGHERAGQQARATGELRVQQGKADAQVSDGKAGVQGTES